MLIHSPEMRMACKLGSCSWFLIRYLHHNIGSVGSSAKLTACVAVFRRVSGVLWPTYQRVWIKHTSKRCWASIRRNENMRNACLSASRCRFAHFASRSLQTSLQSSSTRQRPLRLTRICDHLMRKRRCCQHAPVWLPLSIGKTAKLYNSRTSPSRSS